MYIYIFIIRFKEKVEKINVIRGEVTVAMMIGRRCKPVRPPSFDRAASSSSSSSFPSSGVSLTTFYP